MVNSLLRSFMRNLVAAVSLVVLGLVQPVCAGQFDDAVAAYNAGDYAKALQTWKPLADGGDIQAQIAIGALYADGRGVKQSYADAMTWFRRAADQGSARA